MGSEIQDTKRASKEVTVVVNIRIKPGCEKDYDEWFGRFLISERKVPGYLGTTTIVEPGTDSSICQTSDPTVRGNAHRLGEGGRHLQWIYPLVADACITKMLKNERFFS